MARRADDASALVGNETGIDATGRDQVVMRGSLHDLADVQEYNAIGTQDRRPSVGDH